MFDITFFHPLSPARVRDGMENALNLFKKARDEKIRRFRRVLHESATAVKLFPMPSVNPGRPTSWFTSSNEVYCSQHCIENFEFFGIRQPNLVSEIRGSSCSQQCRLSYLRLRPPDLRWAKKRCVTNIHVNETSSLKFHINWEQSRRDLSCSTKILSVIWLSPSLFFRESDLFCVRGRESKIPWFAMAIVPPKVKTFPAPVHVTTAESFTHVIDSLKRTISQRWCSSIIFVRVYIPEKKVLLDT